MPPGMHAISGFSSPRGRRVLASDGSNPRDIVATCLKLRRLNRQPLSGLIAVLRDYCGRGKGDVSPCQILRRSVSGPRRAALGGLALPGSLGGVLLPPDGASDNSGGLYAPCPAPSGFSGVTPVVCLALPYYAPPPPWSVGSALRWLGGARSSPKGHLWPNALLPPEPSSLAGWYGVARISGSIPVDTSSTHVGKQAEGEFITSGNWRGKHNLMSRGGGGGGGGVYLELYTGGRGE